MNECAAIVMVDRTGLFPVHKACCRPTVDEKSSYCPTHHARFFIEPNVTGNKYARGLRKFT